MNYSTRINGIDVEAFYSDESVEDIFLPLLRELTRRQKEKGRRLLVMLAAPPAAGKSTLASFLRQLSLTEPGLTPVTVIGMDGFHRYQQYLLTHTLLRDGVEVPMVAVKGTPETFDLPRLREAVDHVAAGEPCSWPDYDRLLHDPIEGAVRVNGDIVLLEGNYLLLDREGWRDLADRADLTIGITAEESELRDRLVRRKIDSGASPAEAEAFVDFSDLYNARLCLRESRRADIRLRLMPDGSYARELGIFA